MDKGLVFVYGTLKTDGMYAENFDRFRLSTRKGSIRGSLYDLRVFPAFVLEGDDEIYGEIHEYNSFAKVRWYMDQIEGRFAEGDSNNLYERTKVEAADENGETIEVLVYHLVDRGLMRDIEHGIYTKIESGIWENRKKFAK